MEEREKEIREEYFKSYQYKESLRSHIKYLLSVIDSLRGELKDTQEVLEDKRRLTRELDIALNGEKGAARQASLCDLVAQVALSKRRSI